VHYRLQIEGILCKECADVIRRFVTALPYVIDVTFTGEFKEAIVYVSRDIPHHWLQMAVDEAGYTLNEATFALQNDGGIRA
jgi:copper chaperone CopZ